MAKSPASIPAAPPTVTTKVSPPVHLSWLSDTGKRVLTKDKKKVEVWKFSHKVDSAVLSNWAKHFRNQYCNDTDIDALISGTGLTRSDYLTNVVFPDRHNPPGPSIRAGDFAEIMVLDYLEYMLALWVPRTRYDNKAMRNVSTPGTDVIGFLFKSSKFSPKDTLFLYEVKAQFTGKKPSTRLQDAVDGSIKDLIRKSESLNAIKRRFYEKQLFAEKDKIERFQNPIDRPYIEKCGAVVFLSTEVIDELDLQTTDCRSHPNKRNLRLIAISGESLMDLVHQLYEAAANEA